MEREFKVISGSIEEVLEEQLYTAANVPGRDNFKIESHKVVFQPNSVTPTHYIIVSFDSPEDDMSDRFGG